MLGFDYDVVTIQTKTKTSLNIFIANGTGPYTVYVQWGDGLAKQYHYNSAGQKIIEHRYAYIGDKPQHILIKLTDTTKASSLQERAVVSLENPTAPAAQPLQAVRKWWWYWWPPLAVLALVVVNYKYKKFFVAGKHHKRKKTSTSKVVGKK